MSSTYEPHIVQQGEYLTQLAHRYGFNAETVWGHPSNADLKARRSNPNVLAPMDVLYFPRSERRFLPVKIGQANSFTANVVMVPVRITLYDHARQTIKNAACTYEGLDARVTDAPTSTDGAGTVHLQVPTIQAPFVVLVSSNNVRVTVRVGEMDPITERSGVLKRLSHLGFGGCPITEYARALGDLSMSREMESVFIAAYQIGIGQKGTGVHDSATADALLKAHGV